MILEIDGDSLALNLVRGDALRTGGLKTLLGLDVTGAGDAFSIADPRIGS